MRAKSFVFFSESCQDPPRTVWLLELCSKYLLDELNELLSVVAGGLDWQTLSTTVVMEAGMITTGTGGGCGM